MNPESGFTGDNKTAKSYPNGFIVGFNRNSLSNFNNPKLARRSHWKRSDFLKKSSIVE